MITITRHPDMFHLVIINDASVPLREARPLVGLAALNMLWSGEVDVLMVDPDPELVQVDEVSFIEPDDFEFIGLLMRS